MKKIFLILSILFLGTVAANSKNFENALGFMLGGDGGWPNVTSNYKIKKCTLYYEQSYLGMKLNVKYNFDNVIWKSAEAVEENGQLYFIVNGKNGLQNVIAFDESGNDISDTLFFFGIVGGDSTQIRFPILVNVERFEVALKDVMKKCKGIKSKY